MKKLLVYLSVALAMAACGTKSNSDGKSGKDAGVSMENLVEVTFNVNGMTCEGCENAIRKSVESLEGIAEVTSSFEEGWTRVSYDKSATAQEEIEGKIADAGYEVTGLKE